MQKENIYSGGLRITSKNGYDKSSKAAINPDDPNKSTEDVLCASLSEN